MSKFKLYYGGQLFKMAGLVVKEMPPEKDVLTYTYEDGIYTMSISNPSRTTLRLLEQGNLVIAASVRDIANVPLFISKNNNAPEGLGATVRKRFHSRYATSSQAGNGLSNLVYIDDLTSFTFDESVITAPRGVGDLFNLSNAHDDSIESITTRYKFILLNYLTGRVYKSYSKTDGYHPITFYNTDEY